jgi:ubiquinone/menaquinone biosynthesis C-methylase UbiE
MKSFAHRSHAPEIMDDLNCAGEVVHRTLYELDLINRWLGGNRITLNALQYLLPGSNEPVTIADLGCGSGEMLALIEKKFPQHNLRLIGVDANPNIIAFARQKHSSPCITFTVQNIFDPAFRAQRFDVILATLFLHHFTSTQLVDILRQLKEQARKAVIINDLHRHPLAYYSIRWLTKLLSRSEMVKYDAPLSVLRGFSRNEWLDLLREAGISRFSLKWKWAFRWQLIIYP